MTKELWAKVRPAYDKVSTLTGAARTDFLNGLRDSEPAVYEELERMLAARDEEFLERPPWSPRRRTDRASTFTAGDVVAGRYRIDAFLGAGGAGEVYRAYDSHRHRDVALKTVRGVLLGGGREISTLRHEINMAALVSHPNVCRVFDLHLPPAEDPLQPVFITMEYLRGETLAARLARGAMPYPEAMAIILDILAGLDCAHRSGVVHRDLKPGNVMLVNRHGSASAVIMDFGLAQELTPGEDYRSVVSQESFVGTPAYMAPEQFRGKPAAPTADIHALGVIMFQMATGRLPFEGETPVVLASKRMSQDAPRASTLEPDVDATWDYVTGRCLEQDPASRPPSASAMLKMLSSAPPLRTPWRALGAAAALVAAALGAFVWRPAPIRQEAKEALAKGRLGVTNLSKEGFAEAIDQFRRAIKIEPNWSEPWAELAYAYAAGTNSRFVDGRTGAREARSAAERALRLSDMRSAKAWGALGWVQSLDFDEWPQAESSFRRALRLDPGDAYAHYRFAVHLRKKGMFGEAEEEIRRGLALTEFRDPNMRCELAFLFWTSDQLDRLREEITEELRLDPNFGLTRYLHARQLKLDGQYDRSARELDFAEQLGLNRATVLVERASLAAYQKDFPGARRMLGELEQLSRTQEVDGLLVAGVYASMGDLDKAFRCLEDAWRAQDSTLLSIATSPVLRPLRGDPRFQSWLKRLHFEAQSMQSTGFKSSSARGLELQPSVMGTR
jgi:tetratricopeptide (TPR) repeat protein